MKFYDCQTAPSPRRVRIFIAEKGLDIETVEVNLGEAEQLSDAFRAINPNCTVPVLELDDGNHLCTTAGIRGYLEAKNPETALLGGTPEEKGRIAETIWKIEIHGSSAIAEALRNSTPRMVNRALPGPVDYAQIPALAERGQQRLQHFLNGVDEMIGDKPFVTGDAYTAADIDLLVTLDFAGWLKMSLPESATNAQRWYEAVKARPSAG